MTAILELAAVSTFTCTAASTLGIGGYAHAKPCIEGIFKKVPRHHQKNHTLEPPHHEDLLAGPLKHKGVQVKMNGSSVGKRALEFNGEILFLSSATSSGSFEPALALGACEVKVNGSKVVAAPPSLPTVELTFASQEEAQKWAKEFTESALVGPPQDRIQELITHSMKVEKHISDLRARSEKVSELEKQNKKLKKDLKLVKCGFDGAEPIQRQGTQTSLATWLLSNTNAAEQERFHSELQARQQELEKANGNLRNKMAEQARSDPAIALRWRSLVNEKLKQQKELDELRQSGSLPSPSVDSTVPQSESFEIGRGFSGQWSRQNSGSACDSGAQEPEKKQDSLQQDFQSWFNNIESRLEYSRQSFLEEKSRNDYTGMLMETPPAPENVDAALRIQQHAQLELLSAISDNRFRSLEERIRSHQLQVSQDCDILQQTLKAQLI